MFTTAWVLFLPYGTDFCTGGKKVVVFFFGLFLGGMELGSMPGMQFRYSELAQLLKSTYAFVFVFCN